MDGTAVVLDVGLALGLALGDTDGEAVGTALGLVLGLAVGETVNVHVCDLCVLSHPAVHRKPAAQSHLKSQRCVALLYLVRSRWHTPPLFLSQT